DGRRDVAGENLIDVLAPDRVHAQDAADPLLAPVGRVQNRRARLESARVDAEERELAHALRVHLDLERKRRERLGVVMLADEQCTSLRVYTLDGRNIGR